MFRIFRRTTRPVVRPISRAAIVLLMWSQRYTLVLWFRSIRDETMHQVARRRGPGAALDALKSKSQLRAALRSRVSPGGALDWLSRENRKDARADLLTAVVAVIDVDTGQCQYANAGHPAPYLTNGSQTIDLHQTGPLLGAFDSTWRTESVMIAPGWTLLLHTDGVTEALGADRQRFGEQRFAELLRDIDVRDPKDLVNEVLTRLATFRVGARTDDVTLVALHRSAEPATSDVGAVAMDTVTP